MSDQTRMGVGMAIIGYSARNNNYITTDDIPIGFWLFIAIGPLIVFTFMFIYEVVKHFFNKLFNNHSQEK